MELMKQPVLLRAIFSGDVDEVERLAHADPAEVNRLDSEKRAPLHAAAHVGEADLVSALLRADARVDVKDNQWLTPLHRACRSSAEGAVAVLLRHGADVNARDKNWQTPAHVAASNNAVKCMEKIMPKMSNVNITDRSGRTCLHLAAYFGHYEMVELLLGEGEASANHADKRDRTAAHWAAFRGHEGVLRLLNRHEADLDSADKDGMTPLHAAAAAACSDLATQVLLDSDVDHLRPNSAGNTPAHVACLNGQEEVLAALFAKGPALAITAATNQQMETPLHIAACGRNGEGCLRLLLQASGGPAGCVQINSHRKDGKTPLHAAAAHGNFACVLLLINAGAGVDARDAAGRTPLHLAARNGHQKVLELLLSSGSDPTAKDKIGRTPLHLASLFGYVQCCQELAGLNGVDLNCSDSQGMTSLHLCAVKGSAECMDFLVNSGASINVQDSDRRLPIHYAAAKCQHDCLFTLISAGSKLNVADSSGVTPLMLCCAEDTDHEHEARCVQYLLSHNADTSLRDRQGFTSLHYACAVGNSEALIHLFDYLTPEGLTEAMKPAGPGGTTPYHLAAMAGQAEVIIMLNSKIKHPNAVDGRGRTPLHVAALRGNSEAASTLMHKGALVCVHERRNDSNKKRCLGRTPVHLAAGRGHASTLRLLLDNTEDASVADARDAQGRTPLMMAAEKGHLRCATELLNYNAAVDAADRRGRTALMRAAFAGQEELVELLLENGANAKGSKDVGGKTAFHLAAACGQVAVLMLMAEEEGEGKMQTLKDKRGFTPLHWAAYGGHEGCVEFLLKDLKKEDDAAAEGKRDFSPLHCAVQSKSNQCLELLLETFSKPAEVNCLDKYLRTPLHIAASHKALDCAELLLAHGGDPNARDAEGKTPLMFAACNSANDIIEKLARSRGCDPQTPDSNGDTALHHACRSGSDQTAMVVLKSCVISAAANAAAAVNQQNDKGESPLHLSAPRGLVETTEALLAAGASVTACDKRGFTPVLAVAPTESAAICLANMLAEYLRLPDTEARRSIQSIANGSLRLSDISSCNAGRHASIESTSSLDSIGGGRGGGQGDSAAVLESSPAKDPRLSSS